MKYGTMLIQTNRDRLTRLRYVNEIQFTKYVGESIVLGMIAPDVDWTEKEHPQVKFSIQLSDSIRRW